jgi:oligopeptide/dipeptide ABC transporter ATP-binding protein
VTLLEVRNLTRDFPIRNRFGLRTKVLRALDEVSITVNEGEVLGIVGETGSGKSTLAKTIAGIHQPTSGSVSLLGQTIAAPGIKPPAFMRAILQYVYQDPGASLDPRWTFRRSLHEPLVIHTAWPREIREAKVQEISAKLGLPMGLLERYPREVSGGQLRRMGLARGLVLKPKVVIFDEPTSGLDAVVQASVLGLLKDLRQQFSLTYLLVSHDIAVISALCERVAVMYGGRFVEIGSKEQVLAYPRHPYTRALVAASPKIGRPRSTAGFVPPSGTLGVSEVNRGCRYKAHCPIATTICSETEPTLGFEDGHGTACWHG